MFRSCLLIALALPASSAVAQDAAPGVAYDAQILTTCRAETAPQDARSCIGTASARCMEAPDGSSTVGMVSCLAQELNQWDALLNASYAALIDRATKADAELAALGSSAEPSEPRLREAQRKWLGWRDAQCAYAAAQFEGGSAAGPVAQDCVMEATAAQVIWLERMLEEGGSR